jgi:hypothetical protein
MINTIYTVFYKSFHFLKLYCYIGKLTFIQKYLFKNLLECYLNCNDAYINHVLYIVDITIVNFHYYRGWDFYTKSVVP